MGINKLIFVIGSGPSGIAVTQALLNQGLKVTMLDAGDQIEYEKSLLKFAVAKCSSGKISKSLLSAYKGQELNRSRSLSNVLPKKLCYGSEFAYYSSQSGKNSILKINPNITALSSHALGGLSNVWGGAILPYRDVDIKDWPISIDDLEPHYRAITEIMPVAGLSDDLEDDFPRFGKNTSPLSPSKQAFALLADLEKYKKQLNNDGISFGRSRLAVNSASCTYCGLCLRGCPHDLIYNSAITLRNFKSNPNFTYISKFVVNRVSENLDSITIYGSMNGEKTELKGGKAYLGSGAVQSAYIILNSIGDAKKDFYIKDSQYFLIPLLRYKATKSASSEKLHTLSQIFLELNQFASLTRSSHLQIYTFNDHYLDHFKKILGIFDFVSGPIVKILLERLLTIQGYLHSDDSSTIRASLLDLNGEKKLSLEPLINRNTYKSVMSVVEILQKNRASFNGLFLPQLLQYGQPGQGSHIGGFLPMQKHPNGLGSDLLGRPLFFKNLHIIDASILPTIPAQTITFTVMANAHRIGSLYQKTI